MVKKLFILISLSIVALDQLVKYFIQFYQPQWNLGVLSFSFIKNTGAGFGIMQGQTVGLAFISLLIAAVLLANYKKLPQERYPQMLWALFLGGLFGNLVDRLFRGYVIDFINFTFWPAFNIADAAISIATIGLIIYYWKK
jgi:signal peptidase II